MTVIVVERVTAALRGSLTRWMLEIRPGVFVGTLSARVREKLWLMIAGRKRLGGCTLVTRAQNEQGFTIQTAGDTRRRAVDYDGLVLLARGGDVTECAD
jgi:CRISPR-associated protein Cas2